MSDPTTTAPALPDAVGSAIYAYRDVIRHAEARPFRDEERDARDLDRARRELVAAILAYGAEREASGRAATLAEVDAAIERLEGPAGRGVIGDFVTSRSAEGIVWTHRDPVPVGHWWVNGHGLAGDIAAPTPTAAILAAAANLTDGGDK